MGDASHVYNTHLVIDNNGDVRGVYRKTHLFDVEVPGGAVLRESDYIKPGTTIEPPVVTPVGRVGMAIVSFVFNYLTHILSLLYFVILINITIPLPKSGFVTSNPPPGLIPMVS